MGKLFGLVSRMSVKNVPSNVRQLLGVAAVLVALLSRPALGLERYEFERREMGMAFRISLYAETKEVANRAADAAYARIHELNGIFSDYEPESELMRLSRTGGEGKAVRVSEDMWKVLLKSQEFSQKSDGAFDITVGPAVQLWRKSRRTKKLPDERTLQEARAAIGYQYVKLDREHRTVELLKQKMRLDAGGIAAGYAVDEALAVLRKQGIERAMIDGSGDIAVSRAPPGKKGWRIGIAPLEPEAPPSLYVELENAAISTAGDAWQFVEIAGVRYSHIVDPRTALGLTTRCGVTVIAPNCASADGLDTALCGMTPERGLKLVDETPGAAAVLIFVVDKQVKTYKSARLKAYETTGSPK